MTATCSSGFLAVDGDAGSETGKKSPDYGKLRLLETTGGTVNGPGQVYNDMRTSTVTSNDASLGRQLTLAQFISTTSSTGASVIFGNQLTLPVGGGLLYVQPIYVQARSTGSGTYPRLVGRRGRLRRQDRLGRLARRGAQRPLRRLVGRAGRRHRDDTARPDPGAGQHADADTVGHGDAAPAGTPDSAALSKALKDAQAAYVEGEAALRKGDFAAYGQAQAELKDALERAVDASPQGKATATP